MNEGAKVFITRKRGSVISYITGFSVGEKKEKIIYIDVEPYYGGSEGSVKYTKSKSKIKD